MIKSNYHTHTNFCDGDCDVESLVKIAVEKGFKYLGFSSHSYIEGDDLWTLKKDALNDYIEEVLIVKQKYKNQICVLLGIEQDVNSKIYDYNFDYVIGSMHSVVKDGKTYSIDYSLESFKNLLQNVYLGNFDALCKDYYSQLKSVAVKTKANVIGHVDIITKYVDKLGLALPKNYLSYAKDAIEEILKSANVFEINTGAIARGLKKEPYPSKDILSIIFNLGGKIMINSDCHNESGLDFGFDEAEKLAKSVGFKSRVIVTEKGFKDIKL